ncbi:PREDICTED: uncharacterized protein LOC105954678 isoform X1 [Erythranthe guttata]|nr:PREDICTED: uncharacterized protein LOC105954678 isoform X1 [Erythranthe guttata]XP_012833809.1 PREDICTED: uncharacterized protein LOC105954678 isoform X1 [Erythranthe guttata]|eukprot:XP_012833808.1 PREDICTED: uncharacterized protein LOC105954678 isoform X1 [Erythranthe guttata]
MSSDGKKRKRPKPYETQFPVELFLNSLPSSKPDFCRLIAVVSIAAAVAVACNFVATSFSQPPKPFCDTTSDPDGSPFDYCEPCPENGECYDGKLKCIDGYRKHVNLCVRDGDVDKAAMKLSKWVEVRLCEAYAQLLCSGTGKCWVSKDELFNELDNYNLGDNHRVDESIYAPAKQRAIQNIHSLLETKRDDYGIEEFKCPESLVNHYKPLSCVVQQWLIKHALLSILTFLSLVGCIFIANRAYQRHHLSVRAEHLYHEVCDILEEKPLESRRVNGECEPWIVASWLRDHLLSPKERKDPLLWRKVEELIQEDSRIDQYPKLLKGESKVVWEWQVEGSLGSSEKRKKTDGNTPELKKSMNSCSTVHRRVHAGEPSSC